MATFDFESHRRNVERQAAAVATKKAGLYRPDGQSFFSPDEHRQRLATVLAPLQQTVANAQELATAAEAEARRLRALAYRDPLQRLDTETLQRMAALQGFVREEIEQMPIGELGQRLNAVAQHGDVAHKYLYLRYATRREDVRSTPAFSGSIASLEASLVDSEAEKAAATATQLQSDAVSLSMFAADKLAEVDGSAAEAMVARRAEYGIL